MAHLSAETSEQLTQLNEFLAVNNYVNGDLPGADDVRVFEQIKAQPLQATHSEVFFWYSIIQAFTPNIRAEWKASGKQVEVKAEVKAEVKTEVPVLDVAVEDDLFGDEDEGAAEAAKKAAEERKAKAVSSKPKKVIIAKTIVMFDVKVYEAEDVDLLNRIAAKIRSEIVMDGLVWGLEHQIVEVAYGAKKLAMTMILEDDKVSSEDIFETILSWEDDVQSVDVTTMQKV